MGIAEKLRADIEAYLNTTGVTPTQFGMAAVRDGQFVSRLRKGRSPRATTIDRMMDYIHCTAPPGWGAGHAYLYEPARGVWSPALEADLAAWVKQGGGIRAFARARGLSENQVVGKAWRAGLTPGGKTFARTRERIRAAEAAGLVPARPARPSKGHPCVRCDGDGVDPKPDWAGQSCRRCKGRGFERANAWSGAAAGICLCRQHLLDAHLRSEENS